MYPPFHLCPREKLFFISMVEALHIMETMIAHLRLLRTERRWMKRKFRLLRLIKPINTVARLLVTSMGRFNTLLLRHNRRPRRTGLHFSFPFMAQEWRRLDKQEHINPKIGEHWLPQPIADQEDLIGKIGAAWMRLRF